MNFGGLVIYKNLGVKTLKIQRNKEVLENPGDTTTTAQAMLQQYHAQNSKMIIRVQRIQSSARIYEYKMGKDE